MSESRIMGDRETRVLGRKTVKDEINDVYPKFVLESEIPFLYKTILDSSELDEFDGDHIVYEPLVRGLGLDREIMYVKSGERTFLFSFPVIQDIRWGSTFVKFSDNRNYKGEIPPD